MGLQSQFGAGFMSVTPAGGFPLVVATLQNIGVDMSFDQKVLHGSGAFPVEQARGKGKIEGKATTGRIDPLLFNGIVFGQTAATGEQLSSVGEASSIPATPYTITVTNAATFSKDMGVFDVASAKFLVRVASGPTTGQYSVVESTGVYTFAAADTLKAVKVYYTYASATTGKTVTGLNVDMGAGPIFRVDLLSAYRGRSSNLTLYACQSFKFSLPAKLDDFTLPDIDFSAQDDGSGSVYRYTATGPS